MQRYRRLFQYVLAQRRYFLLIALLTFISTLATALQPWPIKLIVDNVVASKALPPILQKIFSAVGHDATPTSILLLAVFGGLFLFALNSFLEFNLTRTWTRAGQRMIYNLAHDVFAKLQRRSLLFHSRQSVGDSMARIVGDSWCIYQFADTILFTPLHALLIIIATGFLMWQLDARLALISILVAPAMVLASTLMGKPIRAAAKSKREIESRIQSHLQQTLAGIPVVQAFEQEQREQNRFQEFASAAIRAQQRGTLLSGLANLSSGLVATVGTGVVLWLGAHRVLAGELSIGSLLVFVAYVAILQAQFKVLAGVFPAFQQIRASADRVLDVLESEPEIAEPKNPVALANVRGEIAFENVSCGYERSRPILQNINLQIQPGEIIALVGSTGAGKTTLVNLVPRFLDPWQGRVLLDGTDIRNVGLGNLRANVSLVFQEAFLLPISIAENIAFGRPNASQKEIEAAARAASAHSFIERLPQGYNTIVGERGATLSGGERQRISMARAFLKNAPILILDEPTSALDSRTESEILQALESLFKNRTALIVAHRLSTIRHAHRIAVLQNGTICELGTHDELLQRGGIYARLHESQFETTPTR